MVFGPLEVAFPLEDPDACKGLLDSKCPVEAGNPVTYRLGITVDAPIVGVTIDIMFILEDSSGKAAVCYKYAQSVSE